MTGDTGNWKRVRDLFEMATEMDAAKRDDFLAEECGSDHALLAEVQELLRAEAMASDSFIEPPDIGIAPPEEDAEGHRVGEFQLLEVIGRGGMGTVYRAHQDGLNREVAVKVVSRHAFGNRTESERFHREARAAARLDHPNIAKVFVAGSDAHFAWFAMELVPGHSLADEIAAHRTLQSGKTLDPGSVLIPALSTDERPRAAAQIVAWLCDALSHAHAQGVVHRDVKPSNVIVMPTGDIRLVDFGVARDETLGTITRSDQLIGSLLYMSPEQAHVVNAPVDERTDVYSAGVVLYELLTQRRPYDGDTTHEVITKIRLAAPRPVRSVNRSVSRDLDLICRRAMARDLRDRYGSASAMQDDLQRFLQGRPVDAKPIHWIRRMRRWTERHHRKLMAAALVVTTGVAAFALTRDPNSAPRATLIVEGEGDAQVGVRWLDEETQQPGPEVEFRDTGAAGEQPPAGFVRIVVRDNAGTAPREFSRRLVPGETLRLAVPPERPVADGPLGANMVLIEGGIFQPRKAGSPPYTDKPSVVESFYLDTAEVSVGDFRRYLDECPWATPPIRWSGFDDRLIPDDLPMTMVTWEEARAFAEWNGKRLPTHAEWMWAARGEELRLKPWEEGSSSDWLGANSGPLYQPSPGFEEAVAQLIANARPVRSSPEAATPQGVLHMLGNVSEWTESPLYFTAGRPPSLLVSVRVDCGGHWSNERMGRDLRAFDFNEAGPMGARATIGFRCARSAR